MNLKDVFDKGLQYGELPGNKKQADVWDICIALSHGSASHRDDLENKNDCYDEKKESENNILPPSARVPHKEK